MEESENLITRSASFQSQLLASRKQADRLLQPPQLRLLLLSEIDPGDVPSPV